MALPTMQKKSLDAPDQTVRYGRITKQNVTLDGVEVHRVIFGAGARWSADLMPHVGTDNCELPHVAYVVAGRLQVVMADGAREVFGPGDVMMLPPGHDAWSLDDAACTFVEFSAGTGYYTE